MLFVMMHFIINKLHIIYVPDIFFSSLAILFIRATIMKKKNVNKQTRIANNMNMEIYFLTEIQDFVESILHNHQLQ